MELDLAATRFAYWTLSLHVMTIWGVANILDWMKNDSWRLNPIQISIAGIAILALGWSLKEHWWWIPEHLSAVGGCTGHDPTNYSAELCGAAEWFRDNASYTNYAYILMFLGEILAINIFTRKIAGKYWFPATAVFVAALYGIGNLLIAVKAGA